MYFIAYVRLWASAVLYALSRERERERGPWSSMEEYSAALNTSNGWRGRGWERGGEKKKD